MHRFMLAALFAVTLPTGPAVAGVADSPLPEILPGATTVHLYSVPGVITNGGLGTFFACTSLEPTANIQIGVEVFGSAGGGPANDAVATSLSVPPGASRLFATFPAAGISSDTLLGPTGSKGSARILATSKKVMCTVFLADVLSSPPASMTYLTIISKLKQKACN